MPTYETSGVCAKRIHFTVENGIVKNVKFDGGCPGNLQAISALVEGMTVEEVSKRLKGTLCKNKTSCADQLVRALESLEK